MEDLISRQAAIDEIRKCRFVVDAIEKIRGLPSADRPSGEWVYHKDNMPCVRWDRCECDQCHNRTEYVSDYCPNCGAKMVREEGEEE